MPSDSLRRYLDRVEGNLHGPGKADILREIESHVYDRAEALAAARGAPVEDGDLDRAMEELGDPSELAVSYSGEKQMVTPREYAAFWYFTGLVFAVHVTMLFLAVVAQARLRFFPFNVLPAADSGGAGAALMLLSLVVQAYLFDAGLVVMVLFLLRKTIRRVELPNLTFRVETSARPSLFRAAFALALIVLFGVPNVRDWFFTVALTHTPEGVYSLLLPGFVDVRPFLFAFLALSFAKDLLYAFLHERVTTVALDALALAVGVTVCVMLFAQESVVGLPADFPLDEVRMTLFNVVLGRLFAIFIAVLAAVFAARLVKRIVRLKQIWGEKEPERL